MPYLIDGHNLIPKIPGLRLDMPDDENRLIRLLQVFARNKRQSIEVFFDQAPPGHAKMQQSGKIKVIFVRQGTTADQAIADRLRQLKDRKNWTIVSSDRQVQSSARIEGASILSSESFSQLLIRRSTGAEEPLKPDADRMIPSESEIEEWEKKFKRNNSNQGGYAKRHN